MKHFFYYITSVNSYTYVRLTIGLNNKYYDKVFSLNFSAEPVKLSFPLTPLLKVLFL